MSNSEDREADKKSQEPLSNLKAHEPVSKELSAYLDIVGMNDEVREVRELFAFLNYYHQIAASSDEPMENEAARGLSRFANDIYDKLTKLEYGVAEAHSKSQGSDNNPK